MKKPNIKICITFLVLFWVVFSVKAQTPYTKVPAGKSAVIVFYNTENLYDTIDDPGVSDEEFLPSSKNVWSTEKYNTKIKHISSVLAAVDSVNLPAIIGLAEIENQSVLNDLVSSDALKKGKYKIIHEESCDPRGIDVALLYKPSIFKEISHSEIPVYYNNADEKATRECLYVCGIVNKKDTIHIIVNHWKSRSGGTEKTQPKRIVYAQTIRRVVDSVFAVRPNANILLMGDFNDNPIDTSLSMYLNAQKFQDALFPKNLYNLTYNIWDSGKGSHYYKSWELFDQIIVSSNLLAQKSTGLITDKEARIFRPNWILYTNSKGEMVPNRTYGQDKYFGGYSDHLPVCISLWFVK
jgi:predicted extracellular nuclease